MMDGARVRTKLPRGEMGGNVPQEAGPQVQVRGVLKYKKNGVEVRKVVTEMVDWSACKVVEVQLKWYDHAIPAAAVLEVQRVEFRREAINQNPTLSFPTKPRSAPHEIALHQIALLQITPLLISSLVSHYFTSSDSIMNTFPLL